MFVRLDLGAELPVLNGLRSVEHTVGSVQSEHTKNGVGGMVLLFADPLSETSSRSFVF